MKRIVATALLFAAVLTLCGCSMLTVDKMYCLPERSEEDRKLQIAIEKEMVGLEYCAPLTGEYQQSVQSADIDGDKETEYLVFTKGTSDRHLRILVFKEIDEEFYLLDTIDNTGSAFVQVEYAQIDGSGGVEIVVGHQLSDQVIRSVSVYSCKKQELRTLLTVNYTKFLTLDMDTDGRNELFVIRPGQVETDNGVAELYAVNNGVMERFNEASMSSPADKLKRIIVGKTQDMRTAVYTASAVGETALITDVYTVMNGVLVNVSFSNESGTSVGTLRNYFVYAEDIDRDDVVEMPDMNTVVPLTGDQETQRYEVIRWYSMSSDGTETNKLYTYHNFSDGWYLTLDEKWAHYFTVDRISGQDALYIWNSDYTKATKIVTIAAFNGKNRLEQVSQNGYTLLLQTESVVYAAKLEDDAASIGLTEDILIRSFRQIRQEWNTGEI